MSGTTGSNCCETIVDGTRVSVGYLSNITNGAAQLQSKSRSHTVDPKECKRQRERALYGAMSLQQRNDRNKKRRKACQRKNEAGSAYNKENEEQDGNSDWFYRNDSYQPDNLDNDIMASHLLGLHISG
jgi:secreted trypsin-like serine protease